MPAAEPPDDGDPEEAVVSVKAGSNSIPWHPSSFGPPYVYKVCFLGAREAGKSSIARRMVAHTFQSDPYRPTMEPQQLFWRYNIDGKDVLVEIEDMPGLAEVDPSTGELTPEATDQLTSLLKPLLWFEKYKRDKDNKSSGTAPVSTEGTPLMGPGGLPAGKAKGKSASEKLKDKMTEMFAAASSLSEGKAPGAKKKAHEKNPISDERKRMGFIVVADVSSKMSYNTAFAVIDRIFDRLSFDTSDSISCPAAVMIVGNKCDMVGGRDPDLGPPEVIKEQVQERFSNVEMKLNNVTYCECSSRTNVGLEPFMLQMLQQIHEVPQRAHIKAARLSETGALGKLKRKLFTMFPILFEVEDWLKKINAGYVQPFLKKLGIIDFFFGVDGLVPKSIKKAKQGWVHMIKFRWICAWCPPFVRKLKKPIDKDEEEALAEEKERDLEKKAAAGGEAA